MTQLRSLIDARSETYAANRTALLEAIDSLDEEHAAALAGGGERYLKRHHDPARCDAILPGLPPGWRNIASQPVVKRFRHGDEVHEVTYRFDRDELVAEDHPDLSSFEVSPTVATLGFDGVHHRFDVAVSDEAAADTTVFVDSWNGSLAVQIVSPFSDSEDEVAPGSLLAPMPGAVIRVAVQVGDVVEEAGTASNPNKEQT